jgi:predicted nucleic acid-binding protein
VIGGRVLDASAVVAFAAGHSVYAAALVWTAVEEGIVLTLPSTAVATAWSKLREKDHPVLEVLLHLPVSVTDDLTATRARAIGALGGEQVNAHALLCARERGWALVTADASRYSGVDLAGVEVEPLP